MVESPHVLPPSFVKARVVARDAFECGGKAQGAVSDEVFGLFFVLFKVGAGG